MGSTAGLALLRSHLGQAVHTYVPLSRSSMMCRAMMVYSCQQCAGWRHWHCHGSQLITGHSPTHPHSHTIPPFSSFSPFLSFRASVFCSSGSSLSNAAMRLEQRFKLPCSLGWNPHRKSFLIFAWSGNVSLTGGNDFSSFCALAGWCNRHTTDKYPSILPPVMIFSHQICANLRTALRQLSGRDDAILLCCALVVLCVGSVCITYYSESTKAWNERHG